MMRFPAKRDPAAGLVGPDAEEVASSEEPVSPYATIRTPRMAIMTAMDLSMRKGSLRMGTEKAYAKKALQLYMAVRSDGVVRLTAMYQLSPAIVNAEVI